MEITVSGIPDELLMRLDRRARERGVDRNRYIREALEKAIDEESDSDATIFDVIRAPVHAFSRMRGYTEEEIGAFADKFIEDYRSGRNRSGGKLSAL